MDNNIQAIFNQFHSQLIYALISAQGAYPRQVFKRKGGSGDGSSGVPDAETVKHEETVEASGTHQFSENDSTVRIGDTDITVSVTDFMLDHDSSTAVVNGRKYNMPALTKQGAATIQGTDGADQISVVQDEKGDTIVEVSADGQTGKVNLGKIASLTINTGGGNDKISVSVKNYYGGVVINGESGDNNINASVTNAFKSGVNISGGSGDDNIVLSGKALSALVSSEGGNNSMDISGLAADGAFRRRVTGGSGLNSIYGSDNGDTIYGGSGINYISAGAGNDVVFGGASRDVIRAGAGDDTVRAGAGDDIVYGCSGDNLLMAESGDNVLMGGAGNDILRGGAGNDFLYSGGGRNSFHGGAGNNTFGPVSKGPSEIFAHGRTADYLKINTRGEHRAQPVVTDISEYTRNAQYILNYDSDTDYLVDPALVV